MFFIFVVLVTLPSSIPTTLCREWLLLHTFVPFSCNWQIAAKRRDLHYPSLQEMKVGKEQLPLYQHLTVTLVSKNTRTPINVLIGFLCGSYERMLSRSSRTTTKEGPVCYFGMRYGRTKTAFDSARAKPRLASRMSDNTSDIF